MAETLVVLVSGRGALTTLAGVPSVQRHVQAARLLGLDVVVVYPPERRALGAEIRGVLEDSAECIAGDELEERYRQSGATGMVLVVAAEWYLSLSALLTITGSTAPRQDMDAPGLQDAAAVASQHMNPGPPAGRAFARVCERGLVSVPVARVTRAEALGVVAQLGTGSAAAALAALADERAAVFDLDAHSEQRLSDNVSIEHAEEKLIENLFGPQRMLPLLRLRPALAPPLARLFGATALGPAGISALKLVLGLSAAWMFEDASYVAGVSAALLYFFARLVGASGVVLGRASFADSDVREKLDLAGDTVAQIAVLWGLAGGPAHGSGALALAAIATVGVLASTAVAYVFVTKPAWDARRRATRTGAPASPQDTSLAGAAAAGDEFVSRFVQRDGIAYALLFAALTANLDLFLWAAAVASHLFYVLWLLARPRGEDDGTMPVGRPA